jgi:hypothetical protein
MQWNMRRTLKMTAITAAICALYLAFVFGSRWWERKEAERVAQDKFAALPAELSGEELKILHFYASPVTLRRGEKGVLCYGVLNAAKVELAPRVEEIKPALNRCLEIAPGQTTRYRLTAESQEGRRETAELTLEVR